MEEAEEGVTVEYATRWSASGSVLERPLFSSGSPFALSFERDAGGRVRGYRIAATGSSGGEGASAETVRLGFSTGGTLSSAVRDASAEVSSSSFAFFLNGVEELSFNGEKLLTARSVYEFVGERLAFSINYAEDGSVADSIRYDYDSGGRVVRIESGDFAAETLYDAAGRPLFVRSDNKTERTERRFQWDDRGLLVRELSAAADGNLLETVYSYTFGAFGEWTTRDSVRFVSRFGTAAPEKGPSVLRKILY